MQRGKILGHAQVMCLLFFLGCLIMVSSFAASGPGREGLTGGGFEAGVGVPWEQGSSAGNELIVNVGSELAHGGNSIARLGSSRRTVDTLEQSVGAIGYYAQNATLSFYWRVENPRATGLATLYVQMVDAQSGETFPLASFRSVEGGTEWALASISISPSELGLSQSAEYLVRFEADVRFTSRSPAFEIDDVSLKYNSAVMAERAMLLPVDPPDTEPPPPVIDEDGDMQYVGTQGTTLEISQHRVPPNDCPCNGPHPQVQLTVTGFTALDAAAKVKFGYQGTPTMVTVTNFTVTGGNGTYYITCTVPQSPQKNKFGEGVIKVKEYGQVAQTKAYTFDDQTGAQTYFYWGFPDPIATIQVLSSATPSVLGDGSFSVTGNGLHAFQYKRSTGCGTNASNDFSYPAAYTKNGDSPAIKVEVARDGGSMNCSTGVYASTWTKQGAPTICNNTTPCVETGAPMQLVLLNPDNIGTDSNGKAAAKHDWLKGTLDNAITFAPPPQEAQPTFSPGTGFGPINSVGYGVTNGVAGDAAIRRLQNATNLVNFHGSNLYRITRIVGDDGVEWDKALFTVVTKGQSFKGWAPSHVKGSETPFFATKDNATVRSTSTSLQVVPSIMKVSNSTACLTSGGPSGCAISIYVGNMGTPLDYEWFKVGPGESGSVEVGSCSPVPGGPTCDQLLLSGYALSGAPDSQRLVPITAHLDASTTLQGTGVGTVQYTVTLKGDSDYGTVEIRYITLQR
jgi:hypothetical protein